MTDAPPTGPAPAPTEDPTAAELAQLRREKAERQAADDKAREDRVAALEAENAELKAQREKAVKAPSTRADREAATPPATPAATPPAAPAGKPKGKGGASRLWFGPEDSA